MIILGFFGLIWSVVFIWCAIGFVLLIKFSNRSEQIVQDFFESAGSREGRNKVRLSLITWPYHLYRMMKYKK